MSKSSYKKIGGLLASLLLPCLVWAGVSGFDLLKANRLDVDNVRIDGNTVSSTNTNGDIVLNPNGTGGVQFPDLTATRVAILDANNEIGVSTVTPTTLAFLDIGSSLTTLLAAKAPIASPTFTGTVTGTFSGNLTGNVTGNVSGSSGSTTGNALTATTLQTARNINGTSFNGSADITVTAAAGTLTGTTLNPTVVTSSLTSVGTIGAGVWAGTAIGPTKGGTSFTSVATGDLMYGSATDTWSKLAAGTSGKALVQGASIPSWTTLGATGGGTGLTSATTGDIIYASGTDTWAKLAKGTSGKTLVQGASIPSWTTLGVDGGGTGLATLTQYGLLLGNGTGAVNFVGPSTQGQVLQANGASLAPSFTTAPVVGVATGLTGKYGIDGFTSGRIFITAADAAGTYNFILPTTAGNAGEVLTSQGGVSTAMTWTSPSGGSGINILKDSNPRAETGSSSPWTNTGGGTLTVTSTAANVGNGTYAFSYDSSAASDHADSPAITIPAGLYNQNCLLEFRWKGFGTSTTFQVFDGTTVLASQAVSAAASTYNLAQINFACPSSGTLQMRVAASANDAIGYWDEVHLGSATNVVSNSLSTNFGAVNVPAFTTAGFGTTSLDSFWSKRVDDELVVRGYFKAGTTAASTAAIILPTGYVIDTTKFGSATSVQKVGIANDIFTSGTPSGGNFALNQGIALFYDGSTTDRIFFSNTTASNTFNKSNGNAWCSSSDGVAFEFRVPIASWGNGITVANNVVRTPTNQTFLSGTSQTYTRPAGVTHIRVRMVGGGGGGSGGGTGGGCTSGGTGTASTFVQSPVSLSAGGSTGGGCGSSAGGAGGTNSTTGASSGFSVPGGSGQGGGATTGTSGNNYVMGGAGAGSAFGGGGGGGQANGAGQAAATNSGGGGGAGGTGNASTNGGAGGGAGGYVDVWITNPASTFTYTVGAKGAAGSAGTSGFAGAAGGDGIIIVDEYYGANVPVLIGLNTEYPCTFSGPAGYSVNDVAYCLPYLTSGGTWRMRFNVDFNLTNATNPQLTTPFTSYNGGYQAVTCWSISSGQTINYARMDPNSTNINISFAANTSRIICSGDVRLASKPSMVP